MDIILEAHNNLQSNLQLILRLMRRSCVDQFEVSTSPRLPYWAFEQLESGSFKFPSPKAKIVLKYPTQVPALMVNFFCEKQDRRL